MMSVAEASNSIEQAKHGGDHSSRPTQLQARENEQKVLSLWIKGATFQQIAAAGFHCTASGAWRARTQSVPLKSISTGRKLAKLQRSSQSAGCNTSVERRHLCCIGQ